MFDNYTPEQIQLILNQSVSIKDFISKLGYEKTTGGYRYRVVKQ